MFPLKYKSSPFLPNALTASYLDNWGFRGIEEFRSLRKALVHLHLLEDIFHSWVIAIDEAEPSDVGVAVSEVIEIQRLQILVNGSVIDKHSCYSLRSQVPNEPDWVMYLPTPRGDCKSMSPVIEQADYVA